MASGDDESPIVTETDPTAESHPLPAKHIDVSTNLGAEDGKTTTSSLTSIDLTNVQVEITPSPVKHRCYEVLTGGRRPQLKTMPYRKELIARIVQVKKTDFLPSLMTDSPIVLAWYTTNMAYAKLPRKWDRFIMAKALCDFDIIMQEIKSVVPTTGDEPHKLPAPIYEFLSYMVDVREAAEMRENEIPSVKKGKVGAQKGGKRLQDILCLKDISRRDLCATNCANCKHNFVLPVGSTSLQSHYHNN